MITNILELLNLYDYYGISKEIDIAKGVNKIPSTLKEGLTQSKRKWQLKK